MRRDQGASSTGEVVDGKFRLSGDDGLSPGPYRVEVYSIQPTGKKVPDAEDPKTLVDATANIIPDRYNLQSTLKVELPPGGPKEPLSFPLTGAPRSGTGGSRGDSPADVESDDAPRAFPGVLGRVEPARGIFGPFSNIRLPARDRLRMPPNATAAHSGWSMKGLRLPWIS